MELLLNDEESDANHNDIIGMKPPRNRASPYFRVELAMKSRELFPFRKLCALCASETDFFEALTYYEPIKYGYF